jgi:hypothetical protein
MDHATGATVGNELVCFVYLVDLVHLVSFVNQKTRPTKQTK